MWAHPKGVVSGAIVQVRRRAGCDKTVTLTRLAGTCRLEPLSSRGNVNMNLRSIPKFFVACALLAALSAQLNAQDKTPAPPKLKIGDVAPDFKLQYFDGNDLKDVSLSEYRGKRNVVLAFYIFAFTGG